MRAFDLERYQTVFARRAGAIAAPTAGLHFMPETMASLKARRVRVCRVNLKVGQATFQPVEAEVVEDHRMLAEGYAVSVSVEEIISQAKKTGRPVAAVGTTVVRTLESAWRDGRLRSGTRSTDIFIHPGFPFQVVDRLLTNFHLPKSTLLMACGLAACGKHFPGHGDTEVDSHIKLPVVDKGLKRLKKYELLPFQRAIEENVKMIMLGHLKVPALDSSGVPVSISKKAVSFLREKMRFNGIVITDAMNMGGIGAFSEEKAAFMALDARVDLLLHPTDPEKVVSFLEAKNIEFDAKRLKRFRAGLARGRSEALPDFERHGRLSDLLTEKAIRLTADFRASSRLFLIILDDDVQRKGSALSRALKEEVPSLRTRLVRKGSDVRGISLPDTAFVIAAVFSETKAWKGGASSWLYKQIAYLKDRADLFVSFGSPYPLFHDIGGKLHGAQMFAYWDAVPAQRAVAKIIGQKTFGS